MHYDVDPGVKVVNICAFHPVHFSGYRKYGEDYLPFYFNRNTEFKLDNLKGKINIIGYTAKCVPPGFESRSILDMEVFAILTTLYSFQKLISGVKVTLLTDSRVLYYLFSSRVSDSSVKIRRILQDLPPSSKQNAFRRGFQSSFHYAEKVCNRLKDSTLNKSKIDQRV